MALRFIDSFDHWASDDRLHKYTSSALQPNISTGRFGNGLTNAADGNSRIFKTLDAQATWIVGAAVKYTGINANRTDTFKFLDAGTEHVDIRVNSSGKWIITRAGTVLGTGTTTITLDVWYYLEFKVTIHNSTGIAVFRVNGVDEINLSGVDTQNTANATADQLGLFANGAGGPFTYDDLYLLDGTGSAPYNDFLGDCRVEALFPNGNGNSSQFDGSDGNQVDNYLLVDENDPGPNDDTDYVESPDVGDKDTYAYTNLTPTSGTVYAVSPIPFARKSDAGARTIVSVARHSATEEDSASKLLSTSYTYYPDYRTTKPGGGSWSISDVNAAEFGVKVTA